MKEAKKQAVRPTVQKDRALVCPPDAAGRSLPVRIFGTLCRALVISCGAAGLCRFLCDAFYPGGGQAAMLVSFLTVFAFSLAALHPIASWTVGLSTAATIIVCLLASAATPGYLRSLVVGVVNPPLDALYEYGYYSAVQFKMEGDGADAAVHLIVFFISLLFVLCLRRRAHVIAPAIVSTAALVLVFTYNLTVSNLSLWLMFSGFAGILILTAYDLTFVRRNANADGNADFQFSDDRPEMPEGMADRATLRAQKKARRKAKRQERLAHAGELRTVEDELNDYFKAPSKKAKPSRVRFDDPEEKERRRALRAVLAYDRVSAQSRTAMGGFAGAAMLAVALIILAIPALSVDGPFRTIDKIDRRVESVREYVTARLRGDDPVLDLYEYLENRDAEPHSTEAKTREFENIPLFRVGAQYNLNLYLTTWIGTDYENGSWTSFTDDQYYAYRRVIDGVQEMPSEEMRLWFLQKTAPQLSEEPGYDYVKKYNANADYGFATYLVNIERINSFSSSLVLPRIVNPTYGITEYLSMTQSKLPYAVPFDGITAGHLFDEPDVTYSVLAQVPTQREPDWIYNVSELIASFEASREEIERYESARNKFSFKPDYGKISKLFAVNLAKQYIESMTSEERKEFLADLEAMDTYTDFVYTTYLGKSGSELVSALAGEIRTAENPDGTTVDLYPGAENRSSSDPTEIVNRHLLTMAVIDRVIADSEYTEVITKEADPALDGVENFLSVTHEGYCVQYASAVALILREYGIPVRYAEGYLGTSYVRPLDGESRYVKTIRDSNAHAWVEVFYDGIGWIPYETTPGQYVAMYGSESETAHALIEEERKHKDDPKDPVVDPPEDPVNPKEPEDPVTPPEGEDESDEFAEKLGEILRRVGVVLIIVVLVGGVIFLIAFRFVRASGRAEKSRRDLLAAILSDDPSVYGTEDARRAAAQRLTRLVMELLALYGTPPEPGELKDAYARRLSFAYEDVFGYPTEYVEKGVAAAISHEFTSSVRIGELLDAVYAEEFGGGMPERLMKRLAKFYLTLREHEARKLTRLQRLRLKYIEKKI